MNIITSNDIYDFIKTKSDGVNERLISEEFTHLKKVELAVLLNDLLNVNKIEVSIQIINNISTVIYKSKVNINNDYETLILNVLKLGGTSGVWIKDIKNKTNIPHTLLMKILKSLESSCQIKSIKSVKNNRKTYVLYDLIPDEGMTGGIWFEDNDVDLDFTERLINIIYDFIYKYQNKENMESSNSNMESNSNINISNGNVSNNFLPISFNQLIKISKLIELINKSSVLKIDINIRDLMIIVNVMVYDGLIERIDLKDEIYLRAMNKEFIYNKL